MKFEGKKIAFLGDSITAGAGVSTPEHIYWNLIAKYTGAECYGYGIGGTRIAPQRMPMPDVSYENLYFGSRIQTMIPDADIVVVFGGTNDFGHGDAAMGKIGDRTEDTFYGACYQLLYKLIQQYPSAQIVMMTPLHRESEDAPYNSRGIRNAGTLAEYVQAIRESAELFGVPVVDLFRNCNIQPKHPAHKEQFCPDGLHPNDVGHELIARCVIGVLNSL